MEDKETMNALYKLGKLDGRREVIDVLKMFINGDYNSTECKLMYSDLLEWLGE